MNITACRDVNFGGLVTRLIISVRNEKLTGVSFGDSGAGRVLDGGTAELIEAAARQIAEYALGKRRNFDIPLAYSGTDFQMKVWEALLSIPYGETRTYGDIARAAGNGSACRAAGGAVHNNPISIIIPCHRVIGANGGLTGFGGGLPLKKKLLEIEGFKF
jgi:methylated-DNA-[protein]-cysteine S-methyltransferase